VAIPEFDPRLIPAEGMYHYSDGRVSGVLDMGPDWAVIYEWSSAIKGQGHTVMALAWLRENGASTITAFNMGMPPEGGEALSPHAAYWLRMRERGLVQILIDDDGNEFCLRGESILSADNKPEMKIPRRDRDEATGLGF
jgi:hypothetical protein